MNLRKIGDEMNLRKIGDETTEDSTEPKDPISLANRIKERTRATSSQDIQEELNLLMQQGYRLSRGFTVEKNFVLPCGKVSEDGQLQAEVLVELEMVSSVRHNSAHKYQIAFHQRGEFMEYRGFQTLDEALKYINDFEDQFTFKV